MQSLLLGTLYITPLFKDNSGYLPDDFTVEFDYYTAAEKDELFYFTIKNLIPTKFWIRCRRSVTNNSFPFNWIATNDVYLGCSGEDIRQQ